MCNFLCKSVGRWPYCGNIWFHGCALVYFRKAVHLGGGDWSGIRWSYGLTLMSPSSWMCLSVLIVFLLTFKVGSQFTGWYFSSSKICIILVSPLRPLVVFCCWKVRFGFGGFTCQRALLTPSLRASAISSPVGVSGPLTHLFFLHSPLFVFIFFCTVSFYLLRTSCTTSSPYYISHLHYAVVQLTKAFIVETSCCLMKFVS